MPCSFPRTSRLMMSKTTPIFEAIEPSLLMGKVRMTAQCLAPH